MIRFDRRTMLGIVAIATGLLLLIDGLGTARAQTADTRKLVVPFPAGGGLDAVGRLLADRLKSASANWIVENRAGANGNIGAAAVIQAPADGRTVLATSDGVVTVNPALYKGAMQFDPRELDPIGMIGTQPSILVVPTASPFQTVADLVAEGKKRELNYASGGIGSAGHLTMAYLLGVTGIKALHVPFSGGAPAMTALIGAQTDVAFVAIPNALPHVKSGKLRALAVSSAARLSTIGQVPTMIESGYAGFEVSTGYLLMVHRNVPAAAKADLTKRLAEIVAQSDFRERLDGLGLTAVSMGAKETADWLARERTRWTGVIEKHGISAQ